MTRILTTLLLGFCLSSCTPTGSSTADREFVISIIGTNDVHGELLPKDDRGGLTTISGYVNAVRAARAADGGAVLLLDAGDMWQGTIESNLSEGAAVVKAYNALGYAAAAIGNHEFDFGPLGPQAIPGSSADDARGALRQRAIEAEFPLLAANLIDEATGKPVAWQNVRPSVMVDVAGIKVGIIGVMTEKALLRTIAANTVGLRVAPLAAAIVKEALALRGAAANLVIVVAHAGGACTEFDDPGDLSSCNQSGEIFQVAKSLPPGLVDHIFAGHSHHGIAHIVNGISITSSYAKTYAFSRVDMTIARDTGELVGRKIFPPQLAVPGVSYEGYEVIPDPVVAAIADAALQFAAQQKQRKIGITLATPFTLEGTPESALGNLFTRALLDSIDADIAIHNVAGGLRASLPAGDLTFGNAYEMSPFENRVVVINISGGELRQIIATDAQRGRRSIGYAGLRVVVDCAATAMTVTMQLADDAFIKDSDTIAVIVNDYMATGGDEILEAVIPEDGFEVDTSMPLTRDVFIAWLAKTGGTIHASDFQSFGAPNLVRPDPFDSECRL